MIIELVGLPGGGKTTLAERLADRGALIVKPPKGFRLLFESFRFTLRKPVHFFRILTETMRIVPKHLRYSLFVNLVLVHAAKQEIAFRWTQKGRTAVIDQGFFQNSLAAFREAPTDAALEAYLRILPTPDVLLNVCVSQEERERQLTVRGRRPRQEYGKEEMERFEKVAIETAPRLESVLTRMGVPHHSGSVAELSGIALPEGGLFRAQPVRQVLKKISYGILWMLRAFVSGRRESVVLMYHAVEYSSWRLAVTPRNFEKQMFYLRQRNLAAPLRDLVEGVAPPHAVAVTFDDGYCDLLTVVLPLITKYQIPITVFVASDLSAKTDRQGRARLSAEELKFLSTSPLVSIESHAKTHTKFTELSAADAAREAAESADELERMVGKRPEFFAYPFGARNMETDRIVEDAGYSAAFGITDGLVSPSSPRFALPRVQVDATTTPFLFRARITRAVAWHRRLFRP